jgi:LacI family transcriptional regulator
LKKPDFSARVFMAKVTIKDIAALLSTSPKTVSKALNNQPGVSEELRQKIKDTAQALNYIPNIFGKGLSGQSLNTIGFIVPDNVNPSYSVVLRGAEKKAAEFHYNLILCNSNEDVQREQELTLMLIGKHVDGVIICPAYHPEANPNIALLQQFGMPYILFNRTIPHQKHPCVKTDNFRAGYLAGQYLFAKGHTQVLHVTCRDSVIAVEERINGLKAAFQEVHVSIPPANIYRRCDMSIESAYTEMMAVLNTRQDFTAVLAFNDIIAFGVMKAIRTLKYRIPADIAVMGFDNLLFSDVCLTPLTTVNQNLYAIGTTAMETLLQQIQREKHGEIPAIPEPFIVERESV